MRRDAVGDGQEKRVRFQGKKHRGVFTVNPLPEDKAFVHPLPVGSSVFAYEKSKSVLTFVGRSVLAGQNKYEVGIGGGEKHLVEVTTDSLEDPPCFSPVIASQEVPYFNSNEDGPGITWRHCYGSQLGRASWSPPDSGIGMLADPL